MRLYEALQEQMNNVHVYGDYFMASCPWHGRDQHPSLMVHEDGFKCQTCNKSGTLQFLAYKVKAKGLTQVTRSQPVVLPAWKKWEREYRDLQGIATAGYRYVKRYPSLAWYFKKRKIDQFIEMGYLGVLDGWCTFPVFDQHNDVVDIVVRSAKHKQYVVSPNNIHPLYVPDWERILKAETIYVVYGTIDAWALYACGLPVVTGTTGKSLQAAELKPLDKRFIIVPDQYEEPDAYKLAGELGWRAEVKRLDYPSDCKDPDDVRVKCGTEYLIELLQS